MRESAPDPPESRKRTRTDSPDLVPPDESRPGSRRRLETPAFLEPPAPLARERLQELCRSHRDLQQDPSPAVHLAPDAYHNTYRLPGHANGRGMHLFRRYCPLIGKEVYFWARCIYTLARRVQTDQHHVQGCDGWARNRTIGFTSNFIARCGCPVEVKESSYVWLVMPKGEEVVTGQGLRISNGTVHTP